MENNRPKGSSDTADAERVVDQFGREYVGNPSSIEVLACPFVANLDVARKSMSDDSAEVNQMNLSVIVDDDVGMFSQSMSFRNQNTQVYPGDRVPNPLHYEGHHDIIRLNTDFRPSLQVLRDEDDDVDIYSRTSASIEQISPARPSDIFNGRMPFLKNLGAISGVIVPCLRSMLGVLMFVRLPWIIGQSGIGLTVLIILICALSTTLTTLSLSAIASNGEGHTGGIYYLISRSLGPEAGAIIAIYFSLAITLSSSVSVLGMSEAIIELAGHHLTPDDGEWDIRVYAFIVAAFCFLFAMCLNVFLPNFLRYQMVFVIPYAAAIVGLIIGSFVVERAETGVTGYSSGNFRSNASPLFDNETFFSVMAVFYPSASGLIGGLNMLGEIRDPKRTLPLGTLFSTFTIVVFYIGLTIIFGGVVGDVENGGHRGLIYSKHIWIDVTAWKPLFYIGVFASGMSSYLDSFTIAPRILQMACKDGLFSWMKFMKEGYGPQHEPIYAYLILFVISAGFLFFGNLNRIATFTTVLFLASYAIVNYTCFLASVYKYPGWRPTFHYYHPSIALLGSAICFAMMFMAKWQMSIVMIFFSFAIYYYVVLSKPSVDWGTLKYVRMYAQTLKTMFKLASVGEHIKNYRPQILVFSGQPQKRTELIKFCSKMVGSGVLFVGQVEAGDFSEMLEQYRTIKNQNREFLIQEKISCFFELALAETFHEGTCSLLQMVGLGGIRPNTVAMGYYSDWMERSHDDLGEYVDTIRDSMRHKFSMVVVRDHHLIFSNYKSTPIDIWWLADDGGSTLLLPWILSQQEEWKNSPLRIWVPGGLTGDQTKVESRITRLLEKFRIKAETHIIERSFTPPISPEDLEETRKLLAECIEKAQIASEDQKLRVSRSFDVGNIIRHFSKESRMVFVTLPVPSVRIDPLTYMSMLEGLSAFLPPTVMIRGNHENVLTYSL